MSSDSSRRSFILGTGGAALAAATSSIWVGADAAEVIKVGFVSPRSGPLGGFGECDPYVVGLARKALAGGLEAGGKRYAVQILARDSQSDPTRAAQLANELISKEGVDMMLATSTPENVNPVSDASEAAGVPCLSTVVPWESWYFGRGAKPGQPSPFKWTYHFSFGVESFHVCYVSQFHELPTNKKIAALYPNDADGNAIREHLIPLLEKDGFTVVDPGGYEDGTSDYSAQIARFKAENCQIFNTFPLPPDFVTFWNQAAQQGYTKMVTIAQVAKTGLFPSDVEALGSLGNRIATADYWHPDFPYKSPLTGQSSRALSDDYTKSTGKQWTQQLGASLALFDAGIAALKSSGAPKTKAAVAKALSRLNTVTVDGRVDFTHGPVPNVAVMPILGTQWLKNKPGSRFPFENVLTENAGDRNVPVHHKLLPYS
ncbi:MAG TPA: ABC transporter substrate-binding protein [Candidatus Baltobacteraceae bacterium]|nr:ABC transporter substrate-binding protein [Candidatus Baltobacteraceae bacterium]